MSGMPFNQDPFQPEPWQEARHTSDAIFESTLDRSGQRHGATVPSDRPLNVKPTPAGGVAKDGQPNLPLGHATLSDKIVGKTQKVIGKLSNNPELHEKGELRELGGKDAARSEARAPHD